MFGYVKPFKPHMRICEYDTYKAVYCGLCKVLGREYGFVSRMTLSYDFAFLGLMALALNDSPAVIEPQRCAAHPWRKTPCLKSPEGLAYTAAAAEILIYNKVKDDLDDRRFFAKLFPWLLLKLLKRPYRKAAGFYPELAAYTAEQMVRQAKLEKDNCKSIDRASEPSSNILAEIAAGLSENEEQRRILRRFGYLLGRYVYIADAFDDVEKDFRTGGFNPLVIGNPTINDLDLPEIQKRTGDSINFTLGALADSYVQLEIKRFKPITDNIVYLGLKNVFYDLIRKKEENENIEDG
ncbi:MAG: DUF5685 family protein [Prevotella sp.]|nr:DUF5685 family protein [Prevotella sp.]